MALPNSRILIHQPSGGFEGQSTDIEIHAKEILDAARAPRRHLRQAHRPVARSRSTPTWNATNSSSPRAAVEYGLIDRVIESHEFQSRTPPASAPTAAAIAESLRRRQAQRPASAAAPPARTPPTPASAGLRVGGRERRGRRRRRRRARRRRGRRARSAARSSRAARVSAPSARSRPPASLASAVPDGVGLAEPQRLAAPAGSRTGSPTPIADPAGADRQRRLAASGSICRSADMPQSSRCGADRS